MSLPKTTDKKEVFYPAPCIEFFLVQKSVSGGLFLFPHIEDDIRFAFDSGYAGLVGQWDHDVPSYIFGLGRQLIFCADSASFCFLLGVCTYVSAYRASLEDGCRHGRKLMGQEENGEGWYSSAPCCGYIHSTVWSLCICPQADRFLYVPSKPVCLF